MDRIYLMAVDLGTTFIKAAVYDTEGTQISSAHAAVISDSSRPGVFLQSGTEIYRSVLAAMKSAAQQAGSDISARIGAIGFTGQMAGFMGVDRDWNDITSWSCSLDTRYVPYANEQMRTLKQQFLDICGTNAPLMSAKCKWFVSDFPEEASKVAKYMLISSYVIGRLGKVDIEKLPSAAPTSPGRALPTSAAGPGPQSYARPPASDATSSPRSSITTRSPAISVMKRPQSLGSLQASLSSQARATRSPAASAQGSYRSATRSSRPLPTARSASSRRATPPTRSATTTTRSPLPSPAGTTFTNTCPAPESPSSGS